jgi:group I intron endonuclease
MKRDDPIMLRECFVGDMDEVTCIYVIWCFSSGKAYVGSAVNWGRRMRKHRTGLRGNYHDNPHLQSAYNLYGENQFGVFLVETCDVADLIAREQFWIDSYASADREIGYNLCPAAGSRRGTTMTEEQKARVRAGVRKAVIEKPDAWKRGGDKRRGRKNSAVHVAKTVAACSKPFSLVSPDGKAYSGKNVAEFCRKHGLSKSAICQLQKGVRGHHSYKGWRIPERC